MFTSARVVENGYSNISAPDGTPIAIQITGEIFDDEIPGSYTGTCIVDGAAFDSLPPSNPLTDGQPTDPRFVAIMTYVAKWARITHATWRGEVFAQPTVVVRSALEIAALPTLTPDLLNMLDPE